ncbi:MAG: SBBP repeat-containing protein, partial [Pseudomonadota bacterium]|nr:SBBP repeat-containing protein [Pseudomonadota bacterium]
DPSKWRKNIPTYNLISFGEIYKGIELKLKAYGKNIEKLFYIKAGANPERIKLKIKGAKSLNVNKNGELEVETALGIIKFTKPVAYQEDAQAGKKYVEVAYVVEGNEYGFKVKNYDRTKKLIIDPLLASTFLGGGGCDEIHSIAIDSSGNIYVAGCTWSSDFPVPPDAYDTSLNGNNDAFVSKFDSNLQHLLASTFLGGSGYDWANSIAINSGGNVYVAGMTHASGFPVTPDAYDTTSNSNGYDAFVSKFDSNLQHLLASTFLGGGGPLNEIHSIAIDSSNNVYVAGHTHSSDFPVPPDAYDTGLNGNSDAFVSKFDSNLQHLLASTFLGGSGYDWANSIAINSGGNVYVSGRCSSDFPVTPGAYDRDYNGGVDAFVSKFDSNLQHLLASTFLGGSGYDWANSITIDSGGNVYVAGNTYSSGFPVTSNAYDTTSNSNSNGYDAFISKFDSNLTDLLASTFLGGSVEIHSIAIDSNENVYVTGPWSFISKFGSNLQNLLASTFLGSFNRDIAYSIAIDSNGNVYVAGRTYSSDFPVTSNAYDTTLDGAGSFSDTFISKLDSNLSAGGTQSDADSDGLPDNWENQYFGNLNQGPNDDFDTDGLTNLEEYNYGTNPTKLDTDDDGYSDKQEIDAGTNPNDPNDYPASENQPPTASFTYS